MGDYVPPVPAKSKGDRSESSKKQGSYFGDKQSGENSERSKPQSVGDVMRTFKSESGDVDGSSEIVSDSKMMKKLEKKLNVDSYAECYPGYINLFISWDSF